MSTAVPLPGRRTARWGRGRIVALEAAAGCAAAGVAFGGTGGYALTGVGAASAALALLRWRGRTASGHLVRRLRRGAFSAGVRTPPGGQAREAAELGLAGGLFPALEVTEYEDRNGPGAHIGVLCDGRGFAAVLELPPGAYPELPVGALAEWLDADPARPAAAQLLIEQHGLPPWDFHQRFSPTLAYRQLPAARRPVALRSWLVLRYEPWEAPEAAAARGGGAQGARAAVVAATARLRARLAVLRVATTALDGDGVRGLLLHLGDQEAGGRETADAWEGTSATHCLLGAALTGPGDWRDLVGAVSVSGTDRAVVGATVTREPGAGEAEVRCAVRLVSSLSQHVTAERERLLAGPATHALTGRQTAGLVATLPLAHPARSLVEATGFATGVHDS